MENQPISHAKGIYTPPTKENQMENYMENGVIL